VVVDSSSNEFCTTVAVRPIAASQSTSATCSSVTDYRRHSCETGTWHARPLPDTLAGSVVGNQHHSHASPASRQHDYSSQRIVFPWISATTANDLTGRQWGDAAHVSRGARPCWYQDSATEPHFAGSGRCRVVFPLRSVSTIDSDQSKSGQQGGWGQAGHDRSQRSTARKRFGDPSQYRV